MKSLLEEWLFNAIIKKPYVHSGNSRDNPAALS